MGRDKNLESGMEEMADQQALGEADREALREIAQEKRSLASLMSDTEAMLALVRREQLALGESEMVALRDYDQRLRSQSEMWPSETLELDFYSLLERHTNLRTIYFAIVDLEIADGCVESLKSFAKLARERGLSEEEGQRMREVEAELEEVRNKVRAELAPLRPA